MGMYRTAQGKMVDMAALAAQNEKVRAVGNMKVNARGDLIDAKGKVVKPVTERRADSYAKTVGNPGAQARRQPMPNNNPNPTQNFELPTVDLLPQEQELMESSEEELEIEKAKAESKAGK